MGRGGFLSGGGGTLNCRGTHAGDGDSSAGFLGRIMGRLYITLGASFISRSLVILIDKLLRLSCAHQTLAQSPTRARNRLELLRVLVQGVAMGLAKLTILVVIVVKLVRVDRSIRLHLLGLLRRLLLGRLGLLGSLGLGVLDRAGRTTTRKAGVSLRLLRVHTAHRRAKERLERTRLTLRRHTATLGPIIHGRHRHLRLARLGRLLAHGRGDDIHEILVHQLILVKTLALSDVLDKRAHRILKLSLQTSEDGVGDEGRHL